MKARDLIEHIRPKSRERVLAIVDQLQEWLDNHRTDADEGDLYAEARITVTTESIEVAGFSLWDSENGYHDAGHDTDSGELSLMECIRALQNRLKNLAILAKSEIKLPG